MADIRIKDLPTTASLTASDDFIAIDGTTNGTRKLSAAAPAFLTSVTTPSLTSPAATNLTLGLGTGGTALTLADTTLAATFAGAVSVSGTITPSGSVHGANGSAANPSFAFNSDQNTGLYRIGADNIGVAANGANVLDIATTGLTVTGAVTVSLGATIYGLTVGRGGGAINSNVAFGLNALATNTTGVENTCIGGSSGFTNLSGSNNTSVGNSALYTNSTGVNNTAIGTGAAVSATGSSNTVLGSSAAANLTSGANNTVIGAAAGNASGVFNLTNQSNRVVVGDANVTHAYILVAWTVTSDARDKTDVTDAPYGLNFVNELRPITYKWDKREKYADNKPNGTHAETKTQLGFLAQDVITLEKKYGGLAGDLLIADDETDESLKITETKMIPVLVKAIQELTKRLAALEAK